MSEQEIQERVEIDGKVYLYVVGQFGDMEWYVEVADRREIVRIWGVLEIVFLNHITALCTENKDLKATAEHYADLSTTVHQRVAQLEAKLKEAHEVLELYAEEIPVDREKTDALLRRHGYWPALSELAKREGES